jgi:hypothetical protein
MIFTLENNFYMSFFCLKKTDKIKNGGVNI